MPAAAQSATRRIAYNTGIQAAGRLLVMLIGLASVVILTRYLGPAGYGDFTVALVYLSLFGIAADLGLFTIAVREMSRDESRTQAIVSNTLALRALFATVVFSLAFGIGWLLPYTPNVKVAIGIAAVAQLFGLLNSAVVAVFQSRLKMGRAVLADLFGRASAFLAVIGVVLADGGFLAVVGTAAVGSLVTFIVSTLLVRKYARVWPAKDVGLWKRLLRESIPYGAALVLVHLYLRVDIFLLSLLRTSAEVGVYGAIFKVFDIVMSIPGFFNNSVFPVLVRRLKEGKTRATPVIQKAFDALLAGGAGMAAGGMVLAPEIMRIVGGQEFVSGTPALRIVLATLIFSFTILTFSTLFVSLNRQTMVLRVAGAGLVMNVLLNLLLIPRYGIEGSAIATLISEAVVFLVYYVAVRRTIGYRISLRNVPSILIAAGLMAAAVWPLRGLLPLALLVGAVVYLGLLFLFRVFTRDMVAELRR